MQPLTTPPYGGTEPNAPAAALRNPFAFDTFADAVPAATGAGIDPFDFLVASSHSSPPASLLSNPFALSTPTRPPPAPPTAGNLPEPEPLANPFAFDPFGSISGPQTPTSAFPPSHDVVDLFAASSQPPTLPTPLPSDPHSPNLFSDFTSLADNPSIKQPLQPLSNPFAAPVPPSQRAATSHDPFTPSRAPPPPPPRQAPHDPFNLAPPPPFPPLVRVDPFGLSPAPRLASVQSNPAVLLDPFGLPPMPKTAASAHTSPKAGVIPMDPFSPLMQAVVALSGPSPSAADWDPFGIAPPPLLNQTLGPPFRTFAPSTPTTSLPSSPAHPPTSPAPAPAHPKSSAPPCLDIRLPPLQRDSSRPALLAAANGSLFAAPSLYGNMLQYACAATAPCCPASNARNLREEDSDSAPCGELGTESGVVSCILTDDMSRSIWTGHESGKVTRWSIPANTMNAPREEHAWQAHRQGRVTAMCLSAWGQLWTASSSGNIRVWSYANLSGISTPTQVRELRRKDETKPHSRVALMVAGPTGRIVWSCGRTSLCLWHALSGTFLGTLGREAGVRGAPDADEYVDTGLGVEPERLRAIQCRADDSSFGEEAAGDEDEERLQGARKKVGKAAAIVQRWGRKVKQNIDSAVPQMQSKAKMGGVRGVVASASGCMWVAYRAGQLEKYSEYGQLKGHCKLHAGATVACLCAVGQEVWVGCEDGRIRVVDQGVTLGNGVQEIRSWQAHLWPVLSITVLGALVFSLGQDGSIRGWPCVPSLPPALIQSYQDDVGSMVQPHQLRLLAGTWNVNEQPPEAQALSMWLKQAAEQADLVCIALQEIEMGTKSVVGDAAVQYLAKSRAARGNLNAQKWADALGQAVGPTFEKVGLRQMSGILVVVLAQRKLRPFVGELATASVPCGVLGGRGGNKGAVAISISVYRRRMILLSSHFAAHQDKVDERNKNYSTITRNLRFENSRDESAVGPEGPDGDVPGGPRAGNDEFQVATGPGMRDADVVVWAGDFNYRIDLDYRSALDLIHQGQLEALKKRDQCTAQVESGTIFVGLQEGPLSFLPTYKFDKYRAWDSAAPPYDSSEKQRVPAWTDRIFFRGSLPTPPAAAPSGPTPVEVALDPRTCDAYTATMEIIVSDHKPVRAELAVVLPATLHPQRRHRTLQLLQDAGAAGALPRPAAGGGVSVGPEALLLRRNVAELVQIANGGEGGVHWVLGCDGDPGGRLPPWMDVEPSRGWLPGGGQVSVRVQGVWWDKGAGVGGGAEDLQLWVAGEGCVGHEVWTRVRRAPVGSVSVRMG